MHVLYCSVYVVLCQCLNVKQSENIKKQKTKKQKKQKTKKLGL